MRVTTTMKACLIGCAIGLVATSSLRADDGELTFDTDARRWHDTTGKFEITAALVMYHDRQVTLRTAEGKTIDVPLESLSTPDRVYLARQRRIARKEPSREKDGSSVRGATSSQPASTNSSIQGRARHRPGSPENLFGVDWYSLDDALDLAQRDEKPVMWFRVLGDLSGFM